MLQFEPLCCIFMTFTVLGLSFWLSAPLLLQQATCEPVRTRSEHDPAELATGQSPRSVKVEQFNGELSDKRERLEWGKRDVPAESAELLPDTISALERRLADGDAMVRVYTIGELCMKFDVSI